MYLPSCERIKKDGFGLETIIKKLKLIFKDRYKATEDVEILMSKEFPMIIFESQETYNPDPQYHHLREVIK